MNRVLRIHLTDLLGGLPRAATVMLVAASVWLVASATTSTTSQGLNILVLTLGIMCGLLYFAGHLLRRIQMKSHTSWLSTFLPGLAVSGIVFYVERLAGITTFTFIIIIHFIRARLFHPATENSEITASEEQLSVRIKSTLSGNFEAEVFNYGDRIHEELRSHESDLSTREVEALNLSGFAPASLYFITGLNVILNVIIGLNSMEQGRLEIMDLAILALLPLIVFEGIESR